MEYNPTENIINWLNSGKGTRHIEGHICTGPRGPKAAAPQSDADDWIVRWPGLIGAQNDDGPLNGPMAHIPFKYMQNSKF